MSDISTRQTPPDSMDASDLEADIARHRAELADTIDQLTAKLDVKSRVRGQAVRTKEDVSRKVRSLQEHTSSESVDSRLVVVFVGAVIGFVGTGLVLRKRRGQR